MYETAIPEETRQRLEEMSPSRLVVGIPSYRNSRTVSTVVKQLAAALDQHYAALRPVIVHADGHSFDDTLAIATHVPLPPSVRRVATRYQGLPGKGSALRAIFEIATHLRAQAVLVVEADSVSFQTEWLPKLVQPILNKELELVLPLYQTMRPLMPATDLLLCPLLSALFHIPIRQPGAGEVAMAGGVATFFAERDVWETDVARAGVDVWMAVEVALGEGRMGQARLGPKLHRSHESPTLVEAKFLQEIGTLFRMGHLHERDWRGEGAQPHGIATLASPDEEAAPVAEPLPEALTLWRNGKRAMKGRLTAQWDSVMLAPQLEAVRALLDLPDDALAFSDTLWARLVYDFLVVYNLGEGDPDKVVSSLYPLFLLRQGAMLAEAARHPQPDIAREELVQRQVSHFHDEFDYLLQRWEGYISPEQAELWRELGMLP